MKASDFIVELQRHIEEHGDHDVHFAGGGMCRDVRQVETRDMCSDYDTHWQPCEYDLCNRPHQMGILIT